MSRRGLALALCACLIALFLQFRPHQDVDLFWQLKTGQMTLERGELVRHDPFTATHAGDPVPPVAWLSQIAYAGLYAAGSWRLLHQTNALAFAGGLLLATLAIRDDGGSVLAAILGLSLGVLLAAPHCEIRPQTFAVFCLGLLLLLAEARMRPWRQLALAALVLLLWQNLHPSVLLGAMAVGARAGGGWLAWWHDRQAAKPWMPSALAALATLGSVATPLGTGIFRVSMLNAKIARDLGISEWMPLWDPAARQAGAWIVWVVLAISLVLLVRAWQTVRWEDLAVLLALGTLSVLTYRLSLFMAVAMVPVWSRWGQAVWSDGAATGAAVPGPRAVRDGIPSAGKPVRSWVVAGVVAVGLVCALAVPRLLGLRCLDPKLPFAAMQRMHELGVRGVVYNYREWGGPLIWTGYPDWKVTIDGRLYLYTSEEWRRYQEIALGRVPVAEVERRYQPAACFLRPTYHKAFVRLLRESDDWEEAYADRDAIVLIRRSNR